MNKIGSGSLTNQYEYKNHAPFSEEEDVTFFHAVLLDDTYEYNQFSQFEPENLFYRSSKQPVELDLENQIIDNSDAPAENSNALVKLFTVGLAATALLTAIKKFL